MENIGYILLGIVAICWGIAMLIGMIATFPLGIIGKDILAGLRTIIGGEITEYTKMLAESREQALDRMIKDAKRQGANGIVCARFTTSAVMQGSAELLVFGTAVKLQKKRKKMPNKPNTTDAKSRTAD
ncbi:MAG: YbjQ family protein [Desulfobacterales bacterium]|nr:YbjQ family protein [Desulfobacterales bacterium]